MSGEPLLTLQETFDLLGISKRARKPWSGSTAELDWRYNQVEVRTREDGSQELVIRVPLFKEEAG